MKTICC